MAVTTPRTLTVYSDVDGTLVGPDNRIHPQVLAEVKSFTEAGFGFTLATGRSLRGVRRLLDDLPVNLPLVLCNGALIHDVASGDFRCFALSQQLVRDLLPRIVALPGVHIYLDMSDSTVRVPETQPLDEPYFVSEGFSPIPFTRRGDFDFDAEVLKIGVKVLGGRKDVENLLRHTCDDMADLFPGELRCCMSADDYVEFMPLAVSKWSGIEVSQGMQGTRDACICTVGDHHNDLEMIQRADMGVAMGNAIAEIHSAAHRSIGRVEEGAMAHLLRSLRTDYADGLALPMAKRGM